MAGFPVVQPTPLFPREPRHNRRIHNCKHNKKLSLATIIQRLADEREIIMFTPLMLSFFPFAYYVLTGSDLALTVWLCLVTFGMLF